MEQALHPHRRDRSDQISLGKENEAHLGKLSSSRKVSQQEGLDGPVSPSPTCWSEPMSHWGIYSRETKPLRSRWNFEWKARGKDAGITFLTHFSLSGSFSR